MQNKLIATAGLLTALPGVLLFLEAQTSTLQLVGLVIISLGGALAFLSFVTSKGSALAWLALILSLVTLMLGNGYVSTVLNFGLGFNVPLAEDFALSIVLIELSIVATSVFGTYRKYSKELEKAGYESGESKAELGAFSKFMVLEAFGVAIVAGGIFLVLEFAPQIEIDSISGLVIAMIIYFIVASLILRRPATARSPQRS